MNKQEAASFLGVSVRALERYVQQGRIGGRYEKGKTRPTLVFDKAELEGVVKTCWLEVALKGCRKSPQSYLL